MTSSVKWRCNDAPSPRFARRARVSGRVRLILPPLRQCGIEPHSHASLATSESLTAPPNQRLRPTLSCLDKRDVRVVTNVEAGCGGPDSDARRAAPLADVEVVWS